MLNDDQLILLEDAPIPVPVGREEAHWPLLIVDDDEDVHHATEFALRDLHILGRPLEFLHAFNGAEAVDVLRQRNDVAVVLLDVVMEREDAGLLVVDRIRNELAMAAVRIVLRTGQPGYAPELDAIANYDINDYKTKNELTRGKLFTTVTAAIRSFDQIRCLEAARNGLEIIAETTAGFNPELGMQAFADSVIVQLAALIQAPAEGLVCSRNVPEAAAKGETAIRVLAARGRYLPAVREPLSVLGEDRARRVMIACFKERRAIWDDAGLALYYPGCDNADFAVFVGSTATMHCIDHHLIDVFTTNVGLCARNVGLVDRLRQAAYRDPLTRLPNRAAQIATIDVPAERPIGETYVLALIDIDQFSETIDAFGYRFGDLQLQAVARQLRNRLPPEVFVARVGSDVFGVWGPAAVVNPENLRNVLKAPFQTEAGLYTVSFSIGLVRAADTHAGGADLLRDAAIALKRAKLEGPGHDAYYTTEVGVQTRQRMRLLHDLRSALDRQQLFVVYQPQIEIASGRVLGVEALVRWRDGEGQLVPLEQFIGIAEHSGLIVGIGAWVLRTALEAQRQLIAAGHVLRMSVNVSPVQFRNEGFVRMVGAAIAEAKADPGLIELEITESVALYGWPQVIEGMHSLKALGASIAIDDFGTGFSSLSYLARLPADCLKIDRSFITALGNHHSGTPIAEMLIQLGQQLGMRVIAEGVENEAQMATLARLGCREAQGMVISAGKPLPELLDWLAERS